MAAVDAGNNVETPRILPPFQTQEAGCAIDRPSWQDGRLLRTDPVLAAFTFRVRQTRINETFRERPVMKTVVACVFAMLITAGAAFAEGESGPGGLSTGREVGAMPTPEQCAQGWDPSLRMTEVEFNLACDNL